LKELGLSKGLSTTSEWRESLRTKNSCPLCDDIKHALLRGNKPSLLFEEDFIGGAPLQIFFRDLAFYNTTKFILTSRSLHIWLRDVRCVLSSYAISEKRSLLRTSAVAVPFALHVAFLRLYGIAVSDYTKTRVSDHLLRRRYQDFVDLVRIVLPRDSLLLFNPTAMDGWDQLCGFLALRSKCSSVMSISRFRMIPDVLCS
jgi:hypothetical protein